MTSTGTITGKDTNPFSEGHETKPYLGYEEKAKCSEKNQRISQGNGWEPHSTIIDRAETWRPESQRQRSFSDQINQQLVSQI